MSALHIIAGARGGQETKRLYGVEYYAGIGAEGGRPTWQETLEKDRLARQEATKRAKQRKDNNPF